MFFSSFPSSKEGWYIKCPRLSTQGEKGVKIWSNLVNVVIECPHIVMSWATRERRENKDRDETKILSNVLITGESNFDKKNVEEVLNLCSTCVQLNRVAYILELLATNLAL